MASPSHLLLEITLFIIVSFLLAVDNLLVCIVLGTINTILPNKKKIALAFGISESLAILLGFLIGKASTKLLEPWTDYVGPLVIGCIGLFFILSYKTKWIEYLDYRWVLYGLPVSLSIDNIIAGVGLGIVVVSFDIIDY
jgi:putative Mn2+ efflux pump MntP